MNRYGTQKNFFSTIISLILFTALPACNFTKFNEDLIIQTPAPAQIDHEPLATAQAVNVTYNTATDITLAGTDIENQTLSFAIISGGSDASHTLHGTLSGTAPNLSYTPTTGYSGADSFSFTVNDGGQTSVSATVSITVAARTFPDSTDSQIADVRNPYVSKDSATAITIGWTASGESSSQGYWIVYAAGATAPADCLRSTNAVHTSNSAENSITVSSLTPLSTYSARICTLNADGSKAAVGATVTTRTLPNCDWTVQSGDLNAGQVGSLTFSSTTDAIDSTGEMTNFLAAAQAASDPNTDGYKTVCLENSLVIQNSNALSASAVTIPGNNFVIYADYGKTAEIRNDFNADSSAKTRGYYAEGRTGLELHNVKITTKGTGGDGVALVSASQMTAASRLIVKVTGAGGSGVWVDGASSVLTSLADFSLEIARDQSVGLVVSTAGVVTEANKGTILVYNLINNNGFAMGIAAQGSGARFEKIANVSIDSTGYFNHAVYLMDLTSIGQLEDITIRTAGQDAHGIYLEQRTHIDGMNRVTVKRAASATTSAAGIVINRSGGTGYLQSTNIKNVTVCTESGGQLWETGNGKTIAWANGWPSGAAFTFPTSYNAYNGSNPGIENFPFNVSGGTAGTTAGNLLGGTCP